MNFTCFPAIRTIVLAIHAEANAFQTLAVTTIPVALAFALGLVALRTENGALHILPSSLGRIRKQPGPQSLSEDYRPAQRTRTSRMCHPRQCRRGALLKPVLPVQFCRYIVGMGAIAGQFANRRPYYR